MLQLNYDCQIKILSFLSPIDLCAVAETCKHFKHVASDAFKFQMKSSTKYYNISTNDEKLQEQHRILKKFGDLILRTRITDCGVEGSTWKTAFIFEWLERYCAGSLQKIYVDGSFAIVLPPPVVRLMSTVRSLRINAPFYTENLSIALSNCNALTYLNIHSLDEPPESSFYIWDNRFPHLKTLKCGWINTDNDIVDKIETFFQSHTELSVLSMHFYKSDKQIINRIDLSFLKNLLNLEELDLQLNSVNVEGIDSLLQQGNLKEFTFGNSTAEICTTILKSVASVDSLVTLKICISRRYLRGNGRVFQNMKRFKNLSTLVIKAHELDFTTLDTKQIVDLVRHSIDIKRVELDCRFYFDEDNTFFDDLVKVGSSQQRKIVVLIDVQKVSRKQLKLFIKFNREHGSIVEIREKIKKL